MFDSRFALLSKKNNTIFGSWVSFSVSLSENRGFKINPFCNPMTFKFNCDKSLIAKQPTKQWTPRRATKARCFYMFLPYCVEVPCKKVLTSSIRIQEFSSFKQKVTLFRLNQFPKEFIRPFLWRGFSQAARKNDTFSK